MAELKCERYPFLRVNTRSGQVRFHEGRAEASGKQLEEVLALGDEYGVSEVKPASKPPAGGRKQSGGK